MAKVNVKPEGEPKKRRLGCVSKLFVLFVFFVVFLTVLTEFMLPDKVKNARRNEDNVVEAIDKYRDVHGTFPASLKDLGDSKLSEGYWYYRDDKMFVLKYQGAGFLGEDIGEFYRSDKKEWKTLSGNQGDYFALENQLMQKRK